MVKNWSKKGKIGVKKFGVKNLCKIGRPRVGHMSFINIHFQASNRWKRQQQQQRAQQQTFRFISPPLPVLIKFRQYLFGQISILSCCIFYKNDGDAVFCRSVYDAAG